MPAAGRLSIVGLGVGLGRWLGVERSPAIMTVKQVTQIALTTVAAIHSQRGIGARVCRPRSMIALMSSSRPTVPHIACAGPYSWREPGPGQAAGPTRGPERTVG